MSLRILAMVGGLLFCLPFHYLWVLLRQPSPWPRFFLGWIGRRSGARPIVLGKPLRSNVLLVSNHVSWLDIMCIADATGAAFVSKEEVARWPVAGWLATLNDTIFVARTERSAVRGQAGALRAAVESSRPVALFPEGTTSGGLTVLPFRASLLAALFPAPPALRVQPIAIDYGTAAADIAWIGDEPAGSNAKRILGRRGVFPVTLRFLEPLDPGKFPDRKALAAAARNAIVAALAASEPTNDPL